MTRRDLRGADLHVHALIVFVWHADVADACVVYQHVLCLGHTIDVAAAFTAFCAARGLLPAGHGSKRGKGRKKARKRGTKKMKTVERDGTAAAVRPLASLSDSCREMCTFGGG